MWYSVDLPSGRDPTPGPKRAEGEKAAEPRLYLLTVRRCPPSGCLTHSTSGDAVITIPARHLSMLRKPTLQLSRSGAYSAAPSAAGARLQKSCWAVVLRRT